MSKGKIYIAGKISGDPNYKAKFTTREEQLQKEGYTVLKPSNLPLGFTDDEYIHICKAMIDVCDSVYFINDWIYSTGSIIEMEYAKNNNKNIIIEKGV